MKHRNAHAFQLDNPEVVIDLWAYSDEHGSILRLAGKTYVMQGSDEEKLALLRQLSVSDFLSTTWEKVSPNYKILNTDGSEMIGVANESMLDDQSYHEVLFGALIERLADSIPEQVKCIGGTYEKFSLELPELPLCVSTIVRENDDGSLVPMISLST